MYQDRSGLQACKNVNLRREFLDVKICSGLDDSVAPDQSDRDFLEMISLVALTSRIFTDHLEPDGDGHEKMLTFAFKFGGTILDFREVKVDSITEEESWKAMLCTCLRQLNDWWL